MNFINQSSWLFLVLTFLRFYQTSWQARLFWIAEPWWEEHQLQIIAICAGFGILLMLIAFFIGITRQLRKMRGTLSHLNANLEMQVQTRTAELSAANAALLAEVSERKRAEAALRESEARFRSYFELPLVGSAISSPEKGWLEVSVGLCSMLGYPAEELTHLTWAEMTHPDDLAVNVELFDRLMAGEIDTYAMEKRFYRKDGSIIWTNLSVGCVRKPDRSVDYLVTLLDDITERKNIETAESEQRALAEALRDTAAALNSTLKLDDVLDRILNNVGRVVPHKADSIDIILLDADFEIAQIVRHRSIHDHDLAADITNINFPVSQMRNLQEMQTSGAPVIIADTTDYEGWIVTPQSAWIRAQLGVPIPIKGQIIGFLSLNSATPHTFTRQDSDRLRTFADQAAIAIENARLYAEVHELAATDALTGLYNRRGLFQLGEREVERALRFQHPLSAIMLDIDHFKRINDTYGHLIGDRVLRAVAACCRALVRNLDIVVRYGGEEFILLLPETDLERAILVAERLRLMVENMSITVGADENSGPETEHVTASMGVVRLMPDMPDLTSLLLRVDVALYTAKQAGRNRIAVNE